MYFLHDVPIRDNFLAKLLLFIYKFDYLAYFYDMQTRQFSFY